MYPEAARVLYAVTKQTEIEADQGHPAQAAVLGTKTVTTCSVCEGQGFLWGPGLEQGLPWLQARQRALGNIQFIGHLYRKKMLTEKIMHECIKKLLAEVAAPKQEDLECLAKLMSTVGRQLDNPKAKKHMDAYFERVSRLSKNMTLESRIRFMLQASSQHCHRQCNR